MDISRITLFGGCGFVQPSKKKQLQALDMAEEMGAISGEVRRELSQAIGSPPAAATEIVARAALA